MKEKWLTRMSYLRLQGVTEMKDRGSARRAENVAAAAGPRDNKGQKSNPKEQIRWEVYRSDWRDVLARG